MLFSREYLSACFDRRDRWASQRPMHGDFFIHLEDGPRVVQVGEEDAVDYSDPNVVYVPDADALLAMLEDLVIEAGLEMNDVELSLAYDRKQRWHAQLRWWNVLTESVNNESPQEALTRLLFQAWGYLKYRRAQVEGDGGE